MVDTGPKSRATQRKICGASTSAVPRLRHPTYQHPFSESTRTGLHAMKKDVIVVFVQYCVQISQKLYKSLQANYGDVRTNKWKIYTNFRSIWTFCSEKWGRPCGPHHSTFQGTSSYDIPNVVIGRRICLKSCMLFLVFFTAIPNFYSTHFSAFQFYALNFCIQHMTTFRNVKPILKYYSFSVWFCFYRNILFRTIHAGYLQPYYNLLFLFCNHLSDIGPLIQKCQDIFWQQSKHFPVCNDQYPSYERSFS